MSPSDPLLAKLQQEGTLDSSGSFTLDLERARKVLVTSHLRNSHDYILLLVQAAVGSGASWLRVATGPLECRLEFDGHPIKEIEFGSDLALGLSGALALKPHLVRLTTIGWTIEVTGKGSCVRLEQPPWEDPEMVNQILIRHRFDPLRILSLDRRYAEGHRVADRCRRTSGLILNGQSSNLEDEQAGPLLGPGGLVEVVVRGVSFSLASEQLGLPNRRFLVVADKLSVDASFQRLVENRHFEEMVLRLGEIYDGALKPHQEIKLNLRLAYEFSQPFAQLGQMTVVLYFAGLTQPAEAPPARSPLHRLATTFHRRLELLELLPRLPLSRLPAAAYFLSQEPVPPASQLRYLMGLLPLLFVVRQRPWMEPEEEWTMPKSEFDSPQPEQAPLEQVARAYARGTTEGVETLLEANGLAVRFEHLVELAHRLCPLWRRPSWPSE